MELCTSCAKTRKPRNYFLKFLCRIALARYNFRLRLRMRRDSLGNLSSNAARASAGVGGSSGIPGSWATYGVLALPDMALHAKYTSNPPGTITAIKNTSACTSGFVIVPSAYSLISADVLTSGPRTDVGVCASVRARICTHGRCSCLSNALGVASSSTISLIL